MPKKRRREIPTPAWERHHSAIGRTVAGRSPQVYAAAGVVLLIVAALAVVGYGFLKDYIDRQHRPDSTAVRIDDTRFTLRYYAQRLKEYVRQVGGSGTQLAQPQVAFPAVTETLVQETILLRFAGEEGQEASEEEVNNEIATQLGINAGDPNFQTRLQEELARTGLSEEQYRDMMKAQVLRRKMTDKFTAGLPASAESVHYRQILVSSQKEADDIRSQVQSGADFAQLAATKSLDAQTNQNGGDAGWVPRGVLSKELEDLLFSQDVNAVVTYPTGNRVWVYQIVEKAADRPVDDTQKPRLAQKALQEWLDSKRASLKIEELVSNDSAKARWVIDHVYTGA